MHNDPNMPHVEVVIKHIKELLYSGKLLPGEKLPAERRLAEQLGVSRVHVRTALKKLECYGIVKTYPQSGSIISQLKVQALESMITNMLKIEQYDFQSLVEVRIMLEAEAVSLCARNRTAEDIAVIENALAECEEYFGTEHRVDKDFAYHQAIAQGSHNTVLASLLLIITPDILRYYLQSDACGTPQAEVTFEHREMLRCIKEQDEDGARRILLKHLQNIKDFSRQYNQQNHYFN